MSLPWVLDIGGIGHWTLTSSSAAESRGNVQIQLSSTPATTESHGEPIIALRFGRACGSSASLAPSAPRFVIREVVPAWRNRQTRRPRTSLSESSSRFESGRRHPPYYTCCAAPQGPLTSDYVRGLGSVFATPTEPEGSCRPAPTSMSNSQSRFNIQYPIPQISNSQGELERAPCYFLGH